ncbi:hypothetical protein KOI40_04450 [Aestuariicella sp. G3-2]|uniref:hypothetical protein n=1 Tax=Pseudomaricurvus albidus TaxID=2842452 RepID=UPI001C0E69D7|nr:hypothetical protein [Aestuariicella albida]MBU3069058.1 hypothetical protein [Aestuariicella albida]
MPSSHCNCTTLVIGDQRIKITAISQKIANDISYLEKRIATLTAQATPNTVILKTYEDMLDSRLSVLGWLTSYQPQPELAC